MPGGAETWLDRIIGLFGGGTAGASIFWLYGPYLERSSGLVGPEALKSRPPVADLGQPGGAELSALPSQALGSRYQLVGDGKQIFLADLKEGRVWRYYHYGREGSAKSEEEGFLPLPLYYGGKKYYRALEVETGPGKAGETSQAKPEASPEEKKSR